MWSCTNRAADVFLACSTGYLSGRTWAWLNEDPDFCVAECSTSRFWAAPLAHEFKESFRRAFDPNHVAAAASGFELGIQLAVFEGRLNAAHGREYA